MNKMTLLDFIRLLLSKAKLIIVISLIFIVTGVVYILVRVPEYTHITKLMPKNAQSSGGGAISGLAKLTGVDLGSSHDEIDPVIFPQIASSSRFLYELLDEELDFGNESMSFNEYRDMRSTKRLFGKGETVSTVAAMSDSAQLSLSKGQLGRVRDLRGRIDVNINDKNGLITVATTMPSPSASSSFNELVVSRLQEEVFELQTSRHQDYVNYVSGRFAEKTEELNEAHSELAIYQDRNKTIDRALGRINLERLQDNYDVKFQSYRELAVQLELAKLELKKQVPIYSIVDPGYIPVYPSSPGKKVILIAMAFIGVLVGIGIVLVREFVKGFLKQLREP